MDRKHSNTLATKYIAAFGAIYLVWGSTYLAIRFAIETLPPLFMMGARSLLAGGVLYALARLRGAEPPTLRNWRSAAVAGILLFLVGHGGLAWAQQRVTSGVAALISSTTPLWISLLMAAQGSERPFSRRMLAGLVLGFGGVALLAGPGAGLGESAVDPIGVLVLLLADVAWAAGSIYSRGCDFPRSPSLTAGTCLLSGGLCLLLVSHLSGETAALHSVSPRSLASLLYLVAFGSVIAFTAYTWLMRVTSPARVSTHSFVNPAVAVFAGWALAGEALGPRTLLATLAMVAGAAAIVAEGVRFYPAGLRSRACASRWTAVAIGERWTARQPPSSGH